MFGLGGKKFSEMLAVQSGALVPLPEVPDEVFSQKMLGDGVALLPEDEVVLSPVSGTVSTVAETFHAFGITAADGCEILVHIGIDTVEMKGEGFEALVREGDAVKAGTPIARVDLAAVRARGFHTHTVVVATNMEDVKDLEAAAGHAEAGETVIVKYRMK